MPTVITPIRSDNSYFGLSKEITPGTPVAPTYFPRWMDGSQIEIDLKAEEIWEGDGTRRLSQLVKNMQQVKIKLSVLPRMNELCFFEMLAMGLGSDSITTSTPTTTLTSTVTGGTSTSVSLTANTGLTGTGSIQLIVGQGTATVETATFTLPVTGTGPYVLAVAAGYNGGKVKNNHATSDPIASVAIANSSFTSSAIVGATTIVIGNNNGLTGTGTTPVVLSPGTANEEIVTLTTPGTGAGPYTYTIANAGVTKYAHTILDFVSTEVIHVLTDQTDGAYATIEVGLGSLYGAAGIALRVRSCKMETIKRSGKAGSVISYEMEFIGIASTVQSTPPTITLEAHSIFLYTQGTWTLDGSTTGDALNVELFDIEQKNNLDTTTQTEALTLAAIIYGNLAVMVGFEVVYITGSRIQQVYFGSSSGTTDSQTIFLGAFSVSFLQPDNFQEVIYNIPTLAYTKVGMPSPKKDGKHYKQALSTIGTSNMGANTYVAQTTVYNTQYSLN